MLPGVSSPSLSARLPLKAETLPLPDAKVRFLKVPQDFEKCTAMGISFKIIIPERVKTSQLCQPQFFVRIARPFSILLCTVSS